MILLLLGAPGSGKGTQAQYLKTEYGFIHLASGDIFREEIKNKTELGKIADTYISEGNLVPDEIVCKMMISKILNTEKQNILLDGFPRTITQAEKLDEFLSENSLTIDKVILLEIEADILIKRLTSRRVCLQCGANYNLIFKKPKEEGICDICNANLYHRDDDKEETIKQRIDVFERQTKPLIEYYSNKNVLLKINANRSVDEIKESIQERVTIE